MKNPNQPKCRLELPNPFADEMAQKYYQQFYPHGFKGVGRQGEPINIKPRK